MKKKIKNKAFTLIELLVGITIIGIILVGVTNIDYNRLSHKQKLIIFVNNVKTNFENSRNNALSGKGIGTDLNIPTSWKIEYSLTSNGTILTTGVGTTFNKNFFFEPGNTISRIRCLELDGTEDKILNSSEKGTIIFEGINIKLGGDCTNSSSKILELTLNNKFGTKKLLLNTLNGLAEIKK